MGQHDARRARPHNIATRVRALLSLGMVAGLGAVGTLAAWTDSATATTGTFSTATVELKVDGADSYTVSGLAMTDMLPGESVAKTVTVENHSPVPIDYTATVTPVGGAPQMGDFLTAEVYAGETASNSPVDAMRSGSCSGSALTGGAVQMTRGVDALLYSDRRPLAAKNDPDDSETLCLIVGLSTNARSAVENQTVSSVTFTFTGTPAATP